MTRASVLGIPVDVVDTPAALDAIERLLDRPGPHLVVTLNPEGVMAARRDPTLPALLARAALVVPDGVGVVWALRHQGFDRVQRVAGSDLLVDVSRIAARRGLSVFLLGAAPGVARQAADVLVRGIPGLRIAGTESGSPRREEADGLCAAVRASGADLLFVAYGFPAQEKWLAEYGSRTGAMLAIGVGGAFDMLSGRLPRAPRILRQHGIEWAWRLALQPWRVRRQAVLAKYVMGVLRSGGLPADAL